MNNNKKIKIIMTIKNYMKITLTIQYKKQLKFFIQLNLLKIYKKKNYINLNNMKVLINVKVVNKVQIEYL